MSTVTSAAAAPSRDVASKPAMPGPKPVFKNVPISARVPRNIWEMVDRLVPVWRKQAELRGEDFEEIDRSYVIGELLAIQAVAEWAHLGVRDTPTTEEGWDALVKDVVKRVVAEAKSK